MRIDSAVVSKAVSTILEKTQDAPLGKIGSLAYTRAQDPAPRAERGFRQMISAKLSLVRDAVLLAPKERAEKQACKQAKALSRDVGNLLALMTRPGSQESGLAEVADQVAVVFKHASALSRKTGMTELGMIDKVLARHVGKLGASGSEYADTFAELGKGMMQNLQLASAIKQRNPALADGIMTALNKHVQAGANSAIAKELLAEPLRDLCVRMEDKKFLSRQILLNGTLDKLHGELGKKIGDISDGAFLALAVKGMHHRERHDLYANLLKSGPLSETDAFKDMLANTTLPDEGLGVSTQQWRERSMNTLKTLESALLSTKS